ncbi:hypothetical protein J0A68_13330 [Algoriphagus sp. H41]|uniref:Uncharacterized protein n=1 Tax=Algoriphagus oliviformis TaxID=2811231 RepID=A0ABS3C5T5_9BACT|nr:DUF6134 family protein [Algoriphagus oliviformis]MBN7811931.1 hypothetical protein [Algoriphagus oliviformis]
MSNPTSLSKTRNPGKCFFRILLLCAVFCLASPSFSQTKPESIKFEIQVLGLKIGDLNVKRYQVGDTLHYLAQSNVKFWFFGNVDVEIFTHSKYVDGYFVKSLSKSNTNRGNFASSIYWDGKKYVVDAESYKFENDKPVQGMVQWCSAKTFFEEMEEGKTFLSEVYGLTTSIEKTEAGVYTTTLNGNENEYTYQGGDLLKVVLENPIKNFQYRRVD